MTNTNITAFRKNVFNFMEQTVLYGEVFNVSTKNGNAIVISEEEYNSMLETLHLCAIPGMAESIKAAAAEPVEDCIPYDPNEAW